MAKQKFYVVWKGRETGVFTDWLACKKQVDGFEGAQYKSFATESEAKKAFSSSYFAIIKKSPKEAKSFVSSKEKSNCGKPILDSIAVDAACSGNPGKMEYRGVDVKTGKQLFHKGVFEYGTNNIGEFLALVHGLAFLQQKNSLLPIYSDSVNAIAWVKAKKCKTKLVRCAKNEELFVLIERAEKWLSENKYSTKILKWETSVWGEIPADFGRK